LLLADEDAKASGGEKRFMNTGNTVDNAGDADRIILPASCFAGNGDARHDRAVDVGEVPGLDIAICPADTCKYADRVRNLWRTALMSAGSPVIAASSIASSNSPARPRLRKAVILSLPSCPHSLCRS
jgi:hypothetical protein